MTSAHMSLEDAKHTLSHVSESELDHATENWKRGLRGIAFYYVCERPKYGSGCGSCQSCQALRVLMESKGL